MSSPFPSIQKFPRYRLDAPVDVVTAAVRQVVEEFSRLEPAAEVEELPLENISLGGVFIKTSRPQPAGSHIRLRLHTAYTSLGLTGRVVHVIDEGWARRKSHPAGMGLQFEGLSPHTQAQLEGLVEGLVDGARRRRDAARFGPAFAVVTLRNERAALAELWHTGLVRGALYVESVEAPHLGARVHVVIGPLNVDADVVHVDEGRGFGLVLVDLEGKRREALLRYVEGTAATIAVEEVKINR